MAKKNRSIDFKLIINDPAYNLVKQKLLLAESICGRTAVLPAIVFYFNDNGQ